MKRILLVLLLIFSMVICLPSCNDKIEENPEFAKFNAMFEKEFENYTITVDTTSANGDVLNNKYVVTTVDGNKKVNYRIETLNSFSVDGDNITAPDGYKKIVEGTQNVSITVAPFSNDSDYVTKPYMHCAVPKFNFSYTCLNSEIITPISFKANVTSLSKFMSLNVEATDAEVLVEYSGDSVNSIKITYVTEAESTVVIKYTFN
ncbi:MAG: hypothetical protein J6S23_03720 [Clostridia bacterium]|nr:hypothetical protein [Clostridia bacterium]